MTLRLMDRLLFVAANASNFIEDYKGRSGTRGREFHAAQTVYRRTNCHSMCAGAALRCFHCRINAANMMMQKYSIKAIYFRL